MKREPTSEISWMPSGIETTASTRRLRSATSPRRCAISAISWLEQGDRFDSIRPPKGSSATMKPTSCSAANTVKATGQCPRGSKREGQMFAEWNVQNRVGWVEQRETHAAFPADVTGAWVSRCSTHPTFYVLCKHFPFPLSAESKRRADKGLDLENGRP